jgi:hypothetical protein
VTAQRYVAAERLFRVGWTLQYERVAALYKSWGCCRAWVDATGLGDPVVEELEERGITVEGFIFTELSKRQLIEGFSTACAGKAFTVCDVNDLAPHRQELDQFEITVSKGAAAKIVYSVPEGQADDAAFSMMLAWHGNLAGNFGPPRIEPVVRSKPNDEGRNDEAAGRRFVTKRSLRGF